MQGQEAINRLRQGREILRAHGVRSLALFGSTARGDARSDSDVDVLVDLDDSRKFSLIDLSEIKFLIGDLVGARADIALRGRLRSGYRETIERDAIPVF
ncbi:MAG TPA: nucleotidyltransferase domain-containing protein [Rhizomicrobium sp.]|jgi:hypothetical protein|nr:nucleotidyltransferase domain-containing protein [Rhizomicrobium sp.]